MKVWFAHHVAAIGDALRRLLAAPLNTLLSLLVIGIALTLPTAGWVLLDNLREAGRDTANVQEISLFLSLDAGKRDIDAIESRLAETNAGPWRFVSREEALKHLQASEGMAEIVASLPRNPLPDAFVVAPSDISPAALEALSREFRAWPKVAHVQLDSAWVKRFDAFLRIGKLAVKLLGALFAGALIAVTFNTIRLQIFAQAAEIEVARLIGATAAYVRRPFLYFGALQGALGGLVAALLVTLGIRLLAAPVGELAALYGGEFELHALSPAETGILTAAGALLGWLGAQISVFIHLRRIA